jgi:hypothetical protein
MSFDWDDLAQQVIGLGAPLIGGALGGPLGAAAGKILAEALGAADATPDAIKAAMVEKGGETATAAREAEAQFATALAQIGQAQVREVGATQRAEMASGDLLQRAWRPLHALELSLIECPLFCFTLLHALWTGSPSSIEGFGSLSGLLMAYFGARFGVLGVYVSGRSREKLAAATGDISPGAIADAAKSIFKKK